MVPVFLPLRDLQDLDSGLDAFIELRRRRTRTADFWSRAGLPGIPKRSVCRRASWRCTYGRCRRNRPTRSSGTGIGPHDAIAARSAVVRASTSPGRGEGAAGRPGGHPAGHSMARAGSLAGRARGPRRRRHGGRAERSRRPTARCCNAHRLIVDIEWATTTTTADLSCPFCGGLDVSGHAAGCELADEGWGRRTTAFPDRVGGDGETPRYGRSTPLSFPVNDRVSQLGEVHRGEDAADGYDIGIARRRETVEGVDTV